MRLNLGSGRRPLEGAVNLDVSDQVGADVVHDLNHVPWPFEANTFDEIHAYDVLEHVDSVVTAIEEIHRIARPGARLLATVPHFSSANAFTDVTHRHWFGWRSFEPFDARDARSHYSAARFAPRRTQMHFHPSMANRLVWRLANRWPEGYERRWAWVFPAWYLYFELEVVK